MFYIEESGIWIFMNWQWFWGDAVKFCQENQCLPISQDDFQALRISMLMPYNNGRYELHLYLFFTFEFWSGFYHGK